MIKYVVEYEDFDGNELSKVVLFHFSMKAFRKYKELTGNEFYSDYSKVTQNYMDKIYGLKNEEDRRQLGIELLIDPEVSTFLMNFCSSFYAHYKDGRWIQDDATSSEIENSIWLYELLNINLFTKIFQHLSDRNIKNLAKMGK